MAAGVAGEGGWWLPWLRRDVAAVSGEFQWWEGCNLVKTGGAEQVFVVHLREECANKIWGCI